MPNPPAPVPWRRSRLVLCLLLALALLPSPSWAEEGLEAPDAPPSLDGDAMAPDLNASTGKGLEVPDAPPSLEGDVVVPDLNASAGEEATPTNLPEVEGPPSDDEATPGEPDASIPSVTHAPAEPLEPPPLESLTIMLDWYPSPHHAALILAAGNGLPQREGLELTIRTPADPGAPLRLLNANLVDLALTHQLQLHLQVDRGKSPIRVATLVDTPLAGILVRESSGVEGPEGLAGLTLGHATEDGRDILFPALITPHGIARGEVNLVETGFALATAMTEQSLDGLVTPLRLTLQRQLADRGVSTRLLNAEEHGIPFHDGLILVANRDRLSRLREPIIELVDILRDTTLWMIEHPERAWEALVELEPTLDTAANRDAWIATLMRLSAQPAALDSRRYDQVEAYLHANGLIDSISPLERLAVDPGAD